MCVYILCAHHYFTVILHFNTLTFWNNWAFCKSIQQGIALIIFSPCCMPALWAMYSACVNFYAQQHISYSTYMPWQFRLSVRPSHGWISQFSPYSSSIPLVFWGWVSSWNSKGFPLSWGLKAGWGRQNKRISSFKRQNLDNGARYDQSYYWSLIGSW